MEADPSRIPAVILSLASSPSSVNLFVMNGRSTFQLFTGLFGDMTRLSNSSLALYGIDSSKNTFFFGSILCFSEIYSEIKSLGETFPI